MLIPIGPGFGYIGGNDGELFPLLTIKKTHIMNIRNPFSPPRSPSTSTTKQGTPASLSTVGFRGYGRSIYGDLDPPACTRNSATVICGKVKKTSTPPASYLPGRQRINGLDHSRRAVPGRLSHKHLMCLLLPEPSRIHKSTPKMNSTAPPHKEPISPKAQATIGPRTRLS